MVSYLGSLVQFSPAAGRAGRCRQTSLCVGSTPHVPATLGLPHTGLSVLSPSALLRLPAALYGAGPALSVVPVFGSSTTAWIPLRLHVVSSSASAVQAAKGLRAFSRRGTPFPSTASGSGSERLGCPLPGCSTPFPSAASGSGSQRFGRPLPGCGVPFPSVASGPGSQRLGRPLPGCSAPFPSAASGPGRQRLGRTLPGCGAPAVGSQEVFR